MAPGPAGRARLALASRPEWGSAPGRARAAAPRPGSEGPGSGVRAAVEVEAEAEAEPERRSAQVAAPRASGSPRPGSAGPGSAPWWHKCWSRRLLDPRQSPARAHHGKPPTSRDRDAAAGALLRRGAADAPASRDRAPRSHPRRGSPCRDRAHTTSVMASMMPVATMPMMMAATTAPCAAAPDRRRPAPARAVVVVDLGRHDHDLRRWRRARQLRLGDSAIRRGLALCDVVPDGDGAAEQKERARLHLALPSSYPSHMGIPIIAATASG